jgi:hypothetical protein
MFHVLVTTKVQSSSKNFAGVGFYGGHDTAESPKGPAPMTLLYVG